MPTMHKPTSEQTAIIDHMRLQTSNLMVEALAGAAKTTTLTMVMHEVKTRAISIAFNKRIAEELAAQMPPHVECRTLASVGYAMWRDFTRKKISMSSSKRKFILRGLIKKLSDKEQEETWPGYSDLVKAVEKSCIIGHAPDGVFKHARPLADNEAFIASLDFDPTNLEYQLIMETITQGITEGQEGRIDFHDMTLLPAIFPASFDSRPLTLIDEAQDLSALDHRLLGKIIGHRGRVLAVGDPAQSIYGFRGSLPDSMKHFAEKFSMTSLPLTMSFRCPKVVVRHVLWRAPAMQYPAWAKEGTITTLSDWTPADLPEEAAIICRLNAPLFKAAIKLIQGKRRPELTGSDVLATIVKDLESLGKPDMLQAEALVAVEAWRTKMTKKYKTRAYMHDKAECLRVLVEQAPTLAGAIAWANNLAKQKGNIKLMTGHKAKGLEFSNVYFLDEHLIRSDDNIQEANLRYVICTRSQENLTYIRTEEAE
jgi:DNA helicase-2/ATP-dependent DNA helicase PcrA